MALANQPPDQVSRTTMLDEIGGTHRNQDSASEGGGLSLNFKILKLLKYTSFCLFLGVQGSISVEEL